MVMSKTFRMNLATYRKLRGVFPAVRNESFESYMKRLVKELTNLNFDPLF